MRYFEGKVVLITGASSGIGRATAFAFAGAGARLLLCARRLKLLRELEAPLMEAGAAAISLFRLDVRDRATVDAAIAGLPEDWKAIDVLVNNAGLSRGLSRLYEDDPENWDEMIDTNVKGLLAVTRAVVPGMVARNGGHVINLGSTAGHLTYANGAVYCATKAAEKAISEGLKIDLMALRCGSRRSIRGWWRRSSAGCGFAAMRSARQRSTRRSRRSSRRTSRTRSSGPLRAQPM